MTHEYTHAVISMMTDNKCPVWLQEGIAVFEQSRYMPVALTYFKNTGRDEEKRLSINGLESGFLDVSNTEALGASYEGSYTAVLFILDKWGWAGLKGMLQLIKEGQHYANAMDEEFYVSVKVFEDMWNEYIANL